MIKLKFNLFEGGGKEPRQKRNKETNSLENEQRNIWLSRILLKMYAHSVCLKCFIINEPR